MKFMKKNLLFITALIAGNSTFCMEKPDSNTLKEVEAKWAAWDETEQEKLTRETESKLGTTKNKKEEEINQSYLDEDIDLDLKVNTDSQKAYYFG